MGAAAVLTERTIMRVSSIITGAVLCVGVIGGAAILFRTRMSVSQVQGILHERISVGSSHQQVIRVLDSLGVEHSTYNPERREILALWRRSYRSLFPPWIDHLFKGCLRYYPFK